MAGDLPLMTCYLCGSTSLSELTRELRHGVGLVVYCANCRLGMLEQDHVDLRQYYDEEYRKLHGPRLGHASDYDEIFEYAVDCQAPVLQVLTPHLTSSTRLLDVGCSTGHLLYNVKPLVGEAIGIDFDSKAAAYASARVGIETHSGPLAESTLRHRSFDVITAVQVLEHVADPIEFVGEMVTYLKPGGLLFVQVPNLDDPLLSVFGVAPYRSFYFHAAHLFYFTGPALASVMQRAGLEGEVIYAQHYNFMNHLHWAFLEQPQSDSRAGLGRAELSVRDDLAKSPRADLESWARSADRAYKDVLERHRLTDNVAFLGRRAT